MRKLFMSALAALVAFAAVAQMSNRPAYPVLPQDEAVRTGQLENGMKYFIRHNDKQKGLADFYIIHDVGAIQEEDNQQGLAHFLEHMAFNGTKNLPGKMLIEYLEKGNIKNSVNFPNVEIDAEGERVGVIHHNVLNVMNDILGAFMKNGVETKGFNSKAKGDYAYTLVVADSIPDAVINALKSNEDIIKVRKI
jgi:predicted Zn-dependent peptidase